MLTFFGSVGVIGVSSVLGWSAVDHLDRAHVLEVLDSHKVFGAVFSKVVARLLPFVEFAAALGCFALVAWPSTGRPPIGLAVGLLLSIFGGYLAVAVLRTQGHGAVSCGCGPIDSPLSWPVAARPLLMASLTMAVGVARPLVLNWRPQFAAEVLVAWVAVLSLVLARASARRWLAYAEHSYRLMIADGQDLTP